MSAADTSRMAEARLAARDLVRALEDTDASANQVLMKAQKLARLMRDADAQEWLKFELYGYPAEDSQVVLGRCGQYAWRFRDGKIVTTASLVQLEAQYKAAEAMLQKLQHGAAPAAPVANYFVAAATQQVLTHLQTTNAGISSAYIGAADAYHRVRGSIHRYAVDALIAIELGDMAESVFDVARANVDRFVAHRVPRAAEQLVAASEHLRDGTVEGRSSALMACRRLLVSVADAVFPARSEQYVDGEGTKRKVGNDDYKNRLLAYLEQGLRSETTRTLVSSQLKHLVARLDALNENVCRGVHADVTEEEAHLVLLETYIFLAELARVDAVRPGSAGASATGAEAAVATQVASEP